MRIWVSPAHLLINPPGFFAPAPYRDYASLSGLSFTRMRLPSNRSLDLPARRGRGVAAVSSLREQYRALGCDEVSLAYYPQS